MPTQIELIRLEITELEGERPDEPILLHLWNQLARMESEAAQRATGEIVEDRFIIGMQPFPKKGV